MAVARTALVVLLLVPEVASAGVLFGYGRAWHDDDTAGAAANLGLRFDGVTESYYAGTELELGFPTDGDTLHTMINLGVHFAPLVSGPVYIGGSAGGGFMFGPLGAGGYGGAIAASRPTTGGASAPGFGASS